jgi:hypothetical protein
MTDKQIEKQFPELTTQIHINQMRIAMIEGVIKSCVKVENVEDEILSTGELLCLEKNMEIIQNHFK